MQVSLIMSTVRFQESAMCVVCGDVCGVWGCVCVCVSMGECSWVEGGGVCLRECMCVCLSVCLRTGVTEVDKLSERALCPHFSVSRIPWCS